MTNIQMSSHEKHQRIWQTVVAIPPGKVASYGQVADLAGLPGRARLVGKCMAYASDEIQVPWYRVLKSNGQLAFAPDSNAAKKQTALLIKEGVTVNNNRVKLHEFGWQPSLDEILFKLQFLT